MRHTRRTEGAVLVEFAIVALVLYLMIATVMTYGSALWVGQNLQQVVDVGAQEIARLPLPVDAELGLSLERGSAAVEYAADRADFRGEIYDERHLVITPLQLAGRRLLEYADEELPLINRLLISLLIWDPGYGDDGAWRYPGTIVRNTERDVDSVLVPIVDNSAGTIRWVAPVEEIQVDHDDDDGTPAIGPFSLVQPPPDDLPVNFIAGVVALRVNYPFQSAAMSSFRRSSEGDDEPNLDLVIAADDSDLTPAALSRYALVVGENEYVDGRPNTHAGRFGLGRQIALPWNRDGIRQYGVRPYRRVISTQAVYRREVFSR